MTTKWKWTLKMKLTRNKTLRTSRPITTRHQLSRIKSVFLAGTMDCSLFGKYRGFAVGKLKRDILLTIQVAPMLVELARGSHLMMHVFALTIPVASKMLELARGLHLG